MSALDIGIEYVARVDGRKTIALKPIVLFRMKYLFFALLFSSRIECGVWF